MALVPKDEYAGRIDATDPAFPQGKAINIVDAVAGTGTPVEEKWLNDDWGFKQAILDEAGITPSGAPDEVGDSQYLEGLKKIIDNNHVKLNGLKVTRANDNKHYGWGSTAILSGGRWMQIFRASTSHATTNNSQVMMHYSDDEGSTWFGEVEIFRQSDSDARPDGMYVMNAGRIGFILNRAAAGGSPHYSPLFYYTDDEGTSWNSVTITMSSPYTFSAVGGIIDFPASQGGNDTTGFITFGFASAGQLDALTTVDNGDSWVIVHDVNDIGVAVESLSETCYARLGTTDRWLIYSRARAIGGGWSEESAVFATTNLLDWGAPILSGVLNRGTPPAVVYNSDKDTIDLYIVARDGKDLYDYDSALLVSSRSAETLWAANGVHTGYPARIAEIPNWFTGYLYPFKSAAKNYFTMMFGESKVTSGTSSSAVAVLSDVPTSSKDAATIASRGQKNLLGHSVDLLANSNITTEALITLRNSAENLTSAYGAYEDRHNMGGTEYLTYISDDYNIVVGGDTHLDSAKVTLGTVDNDEGLEGIVHVVVPSSSVPSLVSHVLGTSSARTHVKFTNSNGVVGSISTSGVSTAYTTSSDPRLKSDLRDMEDTEILGAIDNLMSGFGVFTFNGDTSKEVAGFNAHKMIDIDGFGSEIGVEGNGPRTSAIGDTYIDDIEGELKVTSAGVDQSKAVPYLLAAIDMLIKKVKLLEDK